MKIGSHPQPWVVILQASSANCNLFSWKQVVVIKISLCYVHRNIFFTLGILERKQMFMMIIPSLLVLDDVTFVASVVISILDMKCFISQSIAFCNWKLPIYPSSWSVGYCSALLQNLRVKCLKAFSDSFFSQLHFSWLFLLHHNVKLKLFR